MKRCLSLLAALLFSCEGAFDPHPPCHGVTCSGHGDCVDNEDIALCLCVEGYEAAPEGAP